MVPRKFSEFEKLARLKRMLEDEQDHIAYDVAHRTYPTMRGDYCATWWQRVRQWWTNFTR